MRRACEASPRAADLLRELAGEADDWPPPAVSSVKSFRPDWFWPMRETDLVDRIRRLAGHSPLIRGIGDDCAIFRPRLNEDLVFTSDFALEDRHFTLKTHTAADIGHLALARSLSDIAAMGAEPVFCLVSLAMPRNFAVQRFFKSLLTLARKCEMTLAGGDLSRFDKVLADVICCGRVPRGKAMLRSSAKPGDLIYVTGKLGKPRHRPQPRIAAGLTLRRLGVKAAMDLSDGLSLDLARLCVSRTLARSSLLSPSRVALLWTKLFTAAKITSYSSLPRPN